MTGKYISFELPDGQIIKGKQRFCVSLGINNYRIVKLINRRQSGTFIYQGIEYRFTMTFANPATRDYIPNRKKTNDRNKIQYRLPYTKVIGRIELTYSSITNNLMSSRSI